MTELTIERLGHHGDGIAPGPIFVPRTLPGEVVSGDVAGDRMEAPRIVTPSSDRVRPPCAHYNACGGCALQHASDAFVARWKVGVVEQALAAQGLSTKIRGLATSPPSSRRRAVIAARRTKKGVLVGFHGARSDTITPIPKCTLLSPALLAGLPICEELARAGASRKAVLRIILTESTSGLDIAVTGGRPRNTALENDLARIAGMEGLARLTWEDEVIALVTPPMQRFGTADVVPPPGGFLQATRAGELALMTAVREAVGDAGSVIDLFAGAGTFSLPLATKARVHAVESDAAALEALSAGWRMASGLMKVTTETRDLFRRPLEPDELTADAVVIDPPRAGAEAQMRVLATSDIPRIAAMSCNPVTFARDAKILTDSGYRLDWLVVVDQFRWSPHVELAACFTR